MAGQGNAGNSREKQGGQRGLPEEGGLRHASLKGRREGRSEPGRARKRWGLGSDQQHRNGEKRSREQWYKGKRRALGQTFERGEGE